MTITPPFHPVVFVRGYAATMAEIEAATADPYMGFNVGSALLRQTADAKPVRFIFESPLLRLIKDHGYVDAYRNGGTDYAPGDAPARSIWVFRYYEPASESLGGGKRLTMEEFALDLRRFLLEVRGAVAGDDPGARERFKVHLVAHSMGGLVGRCYLQNICRHGSGNAALDRELELRRGRSDSFVARFFTYGTPHDGIDLFNANVPDLGSIDRLHMANFNRDRMRQYLKLEKGAPVNTLDGAFPVENLFCLIGSNHRDYQAFAGLAKRAAGAMSDGLVMIRNAATQGSPRAIAYRSHSGPYGLVNSEAGYQNLRRFLFGDLRVEANLAVESLTLPAAVEEQKRAGKRVDGAYYVDVAASVRNALYLLHERSVDTQSALLSTYAALVEGGKNLCLWSGYLLRAAKETTDTALVFFIDLALRVPLFEVGGKFFTKSYVNGYNYRERITFAVRDATIRYGLGSIHGDETPLLAQAEVRGNARHVAIPLASPETARPGFAGTLKLEVAPHD